MDEPAVTGYYHEHIPTLLERMWRRLGYVGSYPDMPEEMAEGLPHWMMTQVKLRISLADRLRLLVSGRAILRVESRAEHDPGQVASASAFQVLPPSREDQS